LIKNIRILPELSNTQRGIVCLLGTVFKGGYPINKNILFPFLFSGIPLKERSSQNNLK
jgi:hypothetical protein